uniref:Uncharacterized protein n=1 Tax=Anguilla anguilla TaxID=7936 RepID=A0A0E9UTD6_ANGAN
MGYSVSSTVLLSRLCVQCSKRVLNDLNNICSGIRTALRQPDPY